VFGFGVGDMVSLVVLLKTEGWWATFSFGAVVAFSLAFLYSVVLAYMEYRRKQNLIPISIIPRQAVKPIEKEKQEEVKSPITERKQEIKLQERPNIITTLAIDFVDKKKVDFHIEIENKGKLVVTNILASFETDEVKHMENEPPMARMLPPEGKISISTMPGIIKPRSYTVLIVTILYRATFEEIEKKFSQKVRFHIAPQDLKTQIIHPEAWEENEGDGDPNEQGLNPALNQFVKPIGTLTLVLAESGIDGTPNLFQFGNEFRSFHFDCIAKVASFKTKTSVGRLVSLDLPILNGKNGKHIVIISWDYLKGGRLRLNGIEKQDMDEHENNT